MYVFKLIEPYEWYKNEDTTILLIGTVEKFKAYDTIAVLYVEAKESKGNAFLPLVADNSHTQPLMGADYFELLQAWYTFLENKIPETRPIEV